MLPPAYLWRRSLTDNVRKRMSLSATVRTSCHLFPKHRGSCLFELNIFRIELGKRSPKGGEDSREVCSRNPIGTVSAATRVALVWRSQNKHCFLAALTAQASDLRELPRPTRCEETLASVAVREGSEKESSATRTTPLNSRAEWVCIAETDGAGVEDRS